MESKIGALWKPETDNQNAPIANGSLDFSKLSEEEKATVHNAFVNGGRIPITLWRNKTKTEDKFPDFNIVISPPYTPGAKKPAVQLADDEIAF
jgi:hypothetical protein